MNRQIIINAITGAVMGYSGSQLVVLGRPDLAVMSFVAFCVTIVNSMVPIRR